MIESTEQQCQDLAEVLEHRLRKMPLETLQKLEELSRDPQRFAATVVSRRKILAYLGWVGVGVATGGVGYVLGVNQRSRPAPDMSAQAAALVTTAENDISRQLATLVEQAETAATQADALNAIATAYGEHYANLYDAYTTWQFEVAQIEQAYAEMQRIQGGVQVIAQLLAWLVDNSITVEVPFLGSVSLSNPSFAAALRAVSGLLENLDQALVACRQLNTQLGHWASADAREGVNAQLLQPLQNTLCPEVRDVAKACENIQTAVLRELERLRSAIQTMGA